jgi:protein-S-isoprenylcysteine O-methyltransferase Ste14
MSRLPSLGPRGEGWFALQVVLMVGVGVLGWLLGPDWDGLLLVLSVVVGSALVAGGVVLGVLGVLGLGQSVSPLPRPSAGGELIESGVYGYVRHPVYVGVMCASVGWALLSASAVALLLAGLLIVVLDLKSRREEAWLRQRYPGYVAYARRVRRFIPGIY